jgi:DNA-binding transcriptional regulator YiaG
MRHADDDFGAKHAGNAASSNSNGSNERESRNASGPPMLRTLPEHVRAIRNARNESAKAFAQAMSVTVSTVEQWEAGTRAPNYDQGRLMHRLATAHPALQYEIDSTVLLSGPAAPPFGMTDEAMALSQRINAVADPELRSRICGKVLELIDSMDEES